MVSAKVCSAVLPLDKFSSGANFTFSCRGMFLFKTCNIHFDGSNFDRSNLTFTIFFRRSCFCDLYREWSESQLRLCVRFFSQINFLSIDLVFSNMLLFIKKAQMINCS